MPRADEILLRNGNIIRGQVISEDAEKVVINIPFGKAGDDGQERFVRMTFPRDRVSRVTRRRSIFEEKPEPIRPALQGRRAEDEPETPAAGEVPAEEPAESPETPPAEAAESEEEQIDPALRDKIASLIGELKITDRDARSRAERQLTAIGEDAVPQVTEALLASDSRLQAISLGHVVGNLGDKRATRALIAQLDAVDRKKTIMRAAYKALKRITGKNIFFDDDDSLRVRRIQQKEWLDWFESVAEDYPPQIGFEEKG
jgi:hypothetical protein